MPSSPDALQLEGVRLQLRQQGVLLAAGPELPGAFLVTPEQAAELPKGPGIWVLPHPGRLSPALAEPMERHPRVMWLACRGEKGTVEPWEVAVAAAFIGGARVVPPAGDLQQQMVTSFAGIAGAAQSAKELVQRAGGGRTAQEVAQDVTHELVANALLDAPVDASGIPKYAHHREAAPEISPEDACRLVTASAYGRLFVSVTDRFGRLEVKPVIRALSQIGERAKLDRSGGGAGLGFRRLLEHSDLLAIRVLEGRACEVTSVISLGEERRRGGGAKSLFFRTERS